MNKKTILALSVLALGIANAQSIDSGLDINGLLNISSSSSFSDSSNFSSSSSSTSSTSSTSSLSITERLRLRTQLQNSGNVSSSENFSSENFSSFSSISSPISTNVNGLSDQQILALINNHNTLTIPQEVNFVVSKKDGSGVMGLAPGQTLSLTNSTLVLDLPYISKNGDLMAEVVNTAVDSKHYNLWVNLGPWYLAKNNVQTWVENGKSSLGSYVMLGTNFLDNKIFNLSSALRVFNTYFMTHTLAPGQAFSYLKVGQINGLLPHALDGFALRTTTKTVCDKNKKCSSQQVTEDFLTPGGGICAMATTYKLASNLFPGNLLSISSRPHSAENYNLNPLAPLETFPTWTEWADATVFSPAPDLVIKNNSKKYITYQTRFSVATKKGSPINSDGTKSRSTYFVGNVTISEKPVSQDTLDWNWKEFSAFTKVRNSIPDYLASPN